MLFPWIGRIWMKPYTHRDFLSAHLSFISGRGWCFKRWWKVQKLLGTNKLWLWLVAVVVVVGRVESRKVKIDRCSLLKRENPGGDFHWEGGIPYIYILIYIYIYIHTVQFLHHPAKGNSPGVGRDQQTWNYPIFLGLTIWVSRHPTLLRTNI